MISEKLETYKNMIYGEKRDVFFRFYELLKEYNARFNLTSITEESEIFTKHFLDSVAGESLFKQNASVAEIGSGAGFPSLPLKIVRPDLKFTLVESTGKKCEFLHVAAKELALENVEIVNARAEELARDARYREKFDHCCARAVARLNTLAEYCVPFIKKGGSFIAYKGDVAEEAEEAKRALKILGCGRTKIFSCQLETAGKRALFVADKTSSTPALYPRGNGKERKKPL